MKINEILKDFGYGMLNAVGKQVGMSREFAPKRADTAYPLAPASSSGAATRTSGASGEVEEKPGLIPFLFTLLRLFPPLILP